jgi:hypothetical protein
MVYAVLNVRPKIGHGMGRCVALSSVVYPSSIQVCKTIQEVTWINWEENKNLEPDVSLRMPGAYL